MIDHSLSYDDVLLVPSYADFAPGDAVVATRLAGSIRLKVPVVAAAMDTVSEKELAIAIALEGGAAVIHRNLGPEAQAAHVAAVKRYLNWIIEDPVTIERGLTAADALRVMAERGVSGLPVLDGGRLCGILTSRDLRFCRDPSRRIEEIMTSEVITESEGATHESAQEKFDRHKIEKLPVVDRSGRLVGLITVKDMEKLEQYPNAALDASGRLVVGAAVSPQDFRVRLPLLADKRVDFLVIDTAHGDTRSVADTVRELKRATQIPVVAGNVATRDGTKRLIDAGADAVKVGVGPGSICTTRVVAGAGVAQFSAVLECAEEAEKAGIPAIADGGIRFSGDVTKAIAAGASTVMVGNLFAGLKEAPGREVILDGRMFKEYRGMGSMGAIQEGAGDRYQIAPGESPVPEGIEGLVPYKGELHSFLYQLVSGLRKGMGYSGCRTIDDLRRYRRFVQVTPAGIRESHPHDVKITQEAPNYSQRY
jgi:IMP dehydrogenase